MGTSPATSPRVRSRSPKQSQDTVLRQDPTADPKPDTARKPEGASNAEAAKPLPPPPLPGQQQLQQVSNNTPDFFASQVGGGSLSLEPNPFEQSFGGGGPETPGGAKLPSVAALTSPSSLLPGSNATPFNWGGGSLRTGPLSPAMLSGPATDYFSDSHHMRGGFPTPNESSLRSGLTPGGSGSMFPAPSPNSQALYAHLASNGGATPSTLDFHRTALSAAAKRDHSTINQQNQPQQTATPQSKEGSHGAPTTIKAEPKPATGPFDPHDNDAANGLYMLAQGAQDRNRSQNANAFPTTSAPSHAHPAPPAQHSADPSPHTSSAHAMSMGSGRGGSEGSPMSDEGEQTRLSSRGKNNKSGSVANGRRKVDEPVTKPPQNKKVKSNGGTVGAGMEFSDDDDESIKAEEGVSKTKITDEEKRKNFLERNRIAALKCRQRKKQWLNNLQSKVDMYTSENDALTAQVTQLREEVVNLKTLLLAHKDCPIAQQQGIHGAFMSQSVEPFSAQMNSLWHGRTHA